MQMGSSFSLGLDRYQGFEPAEMERLGEKSFVSSLYISFLLFFVLLNQNVRKNHVSTEKEQEFLRSSSSPMPIYLVRY